MKILQFIDTTEVNLNSYRYQLLNDKAFYLISKGNHEEAHNIMDSLIQKDKNKPLQLALYFDTKGDIFISQKNYPQAKIAWQNSISHNNPQYIKHTKEKLENLIAHYLS